MTFHSLYYTDCLPGQGLRGGAGFQFQAVSPGVTHEMMALVQRTSLYEAPVSWMREQRPVADYPPSLTHVFDGLYATARGVYLGAEANGVREGNQFTHALATADSEAYGFTRPAQLWDAPWWAEKPAPGTECEPLGAEPETGPWGVDVIREWVLGRPDGEEWLLAVHSAFDQVHDEGARRVLFVADDPSAVLGWIAAGTLLLPQERALRVGFRVFATNPRQSQQHVLALHQEWAGQFADPGRDHGFIVFNLATGRHSDVTPAPAARHWVPRFLRQDPYDVVDAIELAHQFARTRGAGEPASAADFSAAGVVTLGEPTEAGLLTDWLSIQIGQSSEDLTQPVVEAVLASGPDAAALRKLDEAMRAAGLRWPVAERVRRMLFVAELAPFTTASLGETEPLASLAEAAADAAYPERMDALLRVAARFGVQPRIGGFHDGAHRFVRWWADHPGAGLDPDAWSCGHELVDLLRDEFDSRLKRPPAAPVAEDIRAHWWRLFVPRVNDPTDLLDATVISAAVERGGAGTRSEMVDYVLGDVRQGHLASLIWRALFLFGDPTLEELSRYLKALPPKGLTGWPVHQVLRVLEQVVSEPPAAAHLEVIRLVEAQGVLAAGTHLHHLAGQDGALETWLKTSQERPGAPLPGVPPTVLAARAREVTDALVAMPLAAAAAVLERSHRSLCRLLADRLPKIWHTSAVAEPAAALAYLTIGYCPESVALDFETRLRRWVKAADAQQVQQVGRLLADLDPDDGAGWREFAGRKAGPTGQTARNKRIEVEREAKAAKKDTKKEAKKDGERTPGWRLGRRGRER
ncbi:MAG TPA: GTPase-associated protein 1-related protein [Amycolatopsis sp.]|uniref:GTPase-associated protein 1-related protein n=1 Tax=Amycolatopsis sp. TaxID=37632 RepID=UPI002B47658C|nr:GTPase-associated protein 1-related protein [Amycolatopsis sp.]HKS48321.1 GTPase-associated protein 1-related protein [Amycolatopsis sp.]